MEHLWDEVESGIKLLKPEPSNHKELESAVHRTGSSIPQATYQHLIESLPNGIAEIQKRRTFVLCLKVLFLIFYSQNVHSAECQSKNVPFGVKFATSCGFRVHEVCNVTCEHNGISEFKTQMRCLENGKWSPLPMCKRTTHLRSLKPIDCDKLPVNVRESAFCMKINIPEYKCPEMIHMQMDLKNCSRKPNSQCALSCGTTYANVTCLPSGKWSHVPLCKFSRENVCPELELGTLVNCSRREGEKCKVRCPGGKLMREDIICLASGEWTFASSGYRAHETINSSSQRPSKWRLISKCPCPSPNLTEEFETTESCENKKIGEKCHLKCQHEYSMIGKKVITCRKNLSWSSLPICSKKTCPIPVLPDELLFKEDCSLKHSGQRCKLECRDQFQRRKEKPFTCVNGTHWTKFPSCACFPPYLPGDMTTAENCQKKKIGNACHLKCPGNYSIVGLNVITCQRDGSWTTLPECRRNFCLKPNLPKPLIFSEDCKSKKVGEVCQLECLNTEETHEILCLNNTHWSSFPKCSCPTPSFSQKIEVKEDCSKKKPGERCKVSCTDTAILRKRLYVTCQNNSQWSEEPSCRKVICPLPVLPPYLSFDEDCSYKGRGERCKVKCKAGEKPFENEDIKCLKGKRWSPFPSCTCPIPNIRDDLESIGHCIGKQSGEKCKVKCKKELNISGDDFILCKTDLTWTSQPYCLKMHCAKPELPLYLFIKDDCSSKIIGEKCEIFCTEGGEILGGKFIFCLDGLEWSPFPSCTCPKPNLTDYLQLIGDCKNKQPGEECKLSCSSGLKLHGINSIRCLQSLKWTSLPKCGKVCFEPKLPEIFHVIDKCSDKEPGDICKVSCKERGKIVGKPYITCLNETHWSRAPMCTCPNPVLKNILKSLNNCSAKLPGQNCSLMCQNNTTLIGLGFITCGNDTKWSVQPSCVLKTCPKPQLAQILKLNGDCSSKQPGEICEVTCKEGGYLLGENGIKCFENLTWSTMPSCSCPSPNLHNDLAFGAIPLDLCDNKTVGQKCSLKCKNEFSNISFPYITCMKDTKWSDQPRCNKYYCIEPTLPSFLIHHDVCSSKVPGDECLVSCRDGGVIIGNPKIKCLNITHWSQFPDCGCPEPLLDDDLQSEGNCALKKIRDKCNIQCTENKKLIGDPFITCQKNFRWSSQPVCRIQVCTYPLPSRGILEPRDDCFSITVGNTCSLRCTEGGKIIGLDKIKCLNSTHWSTLPDCTCPKPELPEHLKLNENDECSDKKRGNQCKISCRVSQEKLIGNDYITCKEETKWSSFPRCETILCPKPLFPGRILVSVGDCSLKAPNETCELRCKDGGTVLGQSFITCINGTKWTDLPDCSCPSPPLHRELTLEENNCDSKKVNETCDIACKTSRKKYKIICQNSRKWSELPQCETIFCPILTLPEEVFVSLEDCRSKVPGEKCYLRCTQGGQLKGNEFLQCQSNGSWSKAPDCSCPKPDLSEALYTLDANGCISKAQGEKCKLSCKLNKKISGDGSIICRNNTQWSPLPSCEEQSCPEPILPPTLKTENNCSLKQRLEVCELSCSEGGKIIGEKVITCLSNLTWSQFPVCTCPAPDLRNDLKSFSCRDKIPGQKCIISCKDKFSLIEKNFITCTTETKWSPQPQCKRAKCRNQLFSPNSIYEGKCFNKTAGDLCYIRCKGGGNFVRDKNYITCEKTGNWTKPRKCFCPPFIPPDEYILKEDDCSKKLPGENCRIACKNGADLKGKNYIECDNSTRWVTFPPCELNICPSPLLSNGVIILERSCSSKRIGESCRLSCRNGGLLKGSNEIFCGPNGSWSPSPVCICPIEILPPTTVYVSECVGKTIGDICHVACKTVIRNGETSTITCLMESNNMWSPLPSCTCAYPQLYHYIKLRDDCETMTSFPIGKMCDVYCENGGTLFNGTQVICVGEDTWTPSPYCSCAPPPPTQFVNYSNCTATLPGFSCQVSCFKGQIDKTSLSCSRSYNWDEFPTCTIILCRDLTFPDPLIGLNCTNLISGEICRVGCKNGARILGSEFLKCIKGLDYEWKGGQPHCVCTPPDLGLQYEIQQKARCDTKRRGETCSVSCRSRNVYSYITCIMEKDKMWTPFPICRRACSNPVAAYKEMYQMHVFCMKPRGPYIEGDTCTVKCVREGAVITNNIIRCLNNGTWADRPSCSCPHPPQHETFEPAEDCSKKFDFENCILRCKKPGFKINPKKNHVTCKFGIWQGEPACEPSPICPRPQISDPLTAIREDCDSKLVGQTCQLGCKYNAAFINSSISAITCMRGAVWSAAPLCACASFKSFGNWVIYPPGSCDQKRPGELCFVFCNREKKYEEIRCLQGGEWTSPSCGVDMLRLCGPPTVSSSLTVHGHNQPTTVYALQPIALGMPRTGMNIPFQNPECQLC